MVKQSKIGNRKILYRCGMYSLVGCLKVAKQTSRDQKQERVQIIS